MSDTTTHSDWTFLSNHAHVLLCIVKNPELRLRDMANMVGITERAVHKIVSDLTEAGYIDVTRDGRRNVYTTHPEKKLRHPMEEHRDVEALVHLIDNE